MSVNSRKTRYIALAGGLLVLIAIAAGAFFLSTGGKGGSSERKNTLALARDYVSQQEYQIGRAHV
jgi:hypothetical protein